MKPLTWKRAISIRSFTIKLITGLALLAVLFFIFPVFFEHIQQRQGIVLNDFVLSNIPAINVSVPLFICIWLPGLLIAYRALKSPAIFINFLWSFLFLSAFRITTISVTALNPPKNLVILADPILSKFYGNNFITKDLFFSGHTATIFLMYLCLQKATDRIFALIAALLIGAFVLIQHVHYTIDVVFAIPFAYLACYLGLKVAGVDKSNRLNDDNAVH
ncbi:MAG TPA: phosphatase PAP2-related protein [Chitinophagaceae bacterium]|nr:phosphatase PAP2-related protein [Chitinophagaceae bacterium]